MLSIFISRRAVSFPQSGAWPTHDKSDRSDPLFRTQRWSVVNILYAEELLGQWNGPLVHLTDALLLAESLVSGDTQKLCTENEHEAPLLIVLSTLWFPYYSIYIAEVVANDEPVAVWNRDSFFIQNHRYRETLCFDRRACYEFTIVDSAGEGLEEGEYYSLYFDSIVVVLEEEAPLGVSKVFNLDPARLQTEKRIRLRMMRSSEVHIPTCNKNYQIIILVDWCNLRSQ